MARQDPQRLEICRIGRSLFERGYVHATAGNISVRLDEADGGGFLITPIYAAAPEARCIVHTHSTHLVALTLQGVWRPDDIVPPLTPYYVMKVGHVPLIPYHRPGDPVVAEALAQVIAAAAQRGTPLRAVMLDRLGPVVWGESPAQAMATLEELEETARLWLMCRPRPAPLTDAQIDDLRRHFGARW
mgnify:CR=1 FL=1